MKRIFTIIICTVLAVVAQAQTKHIEFMGMPVDGTITDFTKKLAAKGLKADAEFQEYADDNVKCFRGTYEDRNDCRFEVRYDATTKKVYEVKVLIDDDDYDYIQSLKAKYNSYAEDNFITLKQSPEGMSFANEYLIYTSKDDDDADFYGKITVYARFVSSPKEYVFILMFTDVANSPKE